MGTQWRKAVRDVGQEAARAAIVVLAVAAGVAGFASVLASYAILTRELNRGYLATNPASVTIRTDAVDDALLAAIAKVPGVRDVESRRMLGARVKGGAAAWRRLVLFVIPDFNRIRVSKLNREEGSWPPAPGEILIERDAFQVARVHIGDSVVVRTQNGVERPLRVAGRVHDVGQAQARMENIVYGYITPATLALLGEDPSLNQILVVTNGDPRPVASAASRVVEASGHAIASADVHATVRHPHADIMGLLLLALASFGLFVLVLSGIIVVNLLTALMAAQVRQIGVMKTLGGTRAQIARIYFAQTFLLGLAAIAIAIPAGIAGSRVLCRAMAVFLNFDIASFAIPLWVFGLVVVAGVVVPLLAAAAPVWKGTRVSIRRALSDYGAAATSFGTGPFDRLTVRIGGISRPVLLSVRNNLRRRARVLLTIATLAAGGLFFMTALNLRASMIRTLDVLFDTKKYDLAVSLRGMQDSESVARVLAATPGVRAFETWTATEIGRDEQAHHGGSGIIAIGLPPETKLLAPNLVKGRWLKADDKDAIVVNTALEAKTDGVAIGPYRIVGVVREPFSPSMGYVNRPAGRTNNVRVVLERNDPASVERAKGAIEDNLERAGIRAISISSKADSRFGFDQHMVMIYIALIIMSALIAGVGGLGLMTTMSLNVLERRREMGVLRAIGATPRAIWLMVVVEAAFAGVVSWAIAGLAAWPLSRALGNFLLQKMFKSGLDFTFELQGLAVWLVVSLLLAIIGSVAPAWSASKSSVREALAYE